MAKHMWLILWLCWIVETFGAPASKIINGGDADPGAHMHQVSLQYYLAPYYYHICGGSVIGPNIVITAAHCVDGVGPEYFRVVVNDHRMYDSDGTEDAIQVSQIQMHQDWVFGSDYNDHAYPNDIALLYLERAVNDQNSIVPLATEDSGNLVGDECVISGWGYNDSYSGVTNTLQERNMTVLSTEECQEWWGTYIFQGHICVFDGTDAITGGSACSGDSGGPLVCNGVLAGVTSWGMTGCRNSSTGDFLPSVYARVSYYQPWIELTLNRNSIGRG